MSSFFFSILQAILLVAALSVDAFVASFAYGSNRIHIPFSSIAVISFVCTAVLGVSLAAGHFIQPLIPQNMTRILCFLILFLLGIMKLFDSVLKNFIKKHQSAQKNLSFRLFDLRFILKIYVDSTAADQDLSRHLSIGEAASLAFALSIDGLAAGFGAGLAAVNFWQALMVSLLITAAAVTIGGRVGRKIADKLRFDLSWLSGFLLMLLAFLKL